MAAPTLTIGHLYPDLMNTYGDRGNVLALRRRLEWRGLGVKVVELSLGDPLIPGQIDLYVFGGGQDRAQVTVAQDLVAKAGALREDIENGAVMLAVCGGYQLLGKYYVDPDGQELPGLGIFKLVTRAGSTRMIGNLTFTTRTIIPGTRIVGFENHGGQTFLDEPAAALGTVTRGHGNNGQDGTEGIVYKNALGTYSHGSLLPKNPALTDYLLARALARRFPGTILSPLDDQMEARAFAEAAARPQ